MAHFPYMEVGVRWQDWVKGPAAYAALGLGGARRWDISPRISRIFVVLMVLLAMLLLLQWQLIEKNNLTIMQRHYFNICIWSGFLIDFLIPVAWAKKRLSYVGDNWMLVLILLIGIPLLWGDIQIGSRLNIIRPLLALYILIPSFSMILSFFVDGVLLTTLFAAAIIVVVFGFLIAGIDPSIKHAWDGVWWAMATVSMVGYGDVVPTSLVGRMLGMILIVIGIGIFVVLTANFLGLILSRSIRKQSLHSGSEIEILDVMSEMLAKQEEQNKLMKQMQSDINHLKSDSDQKES